MSDSLKNMHAAVSKIVSPVYLVGGSVRDSILGKEPKDYDFTTPLSPDEIKTGAKAAGRRVYNIGEKFGTIGFKVKDESGSFQYVEVTTFRSETYETGNRKPEVKFVTDLKDDLSRRDFTINAIAYDGEKYIDPFGGRLDIMEKKIKAVGDARDRFKEDPLRMLRAARFSSQLGFDIDPNMIGKARAMAHFITTVSRERWVQEMDKLLTSTSGLTSGMNALVDMYLLKYILPELWVLANDQEQEFDRILERTVLSDNDPDHRWAALLSMIGVMFAKEVKNGNIRHPYHELVGIEVCKGICSRLKFSNDRTDLILETVKNTRLT